MPNGVHQNGINTLTPHDLVHFDPSLEPKRYQIKGTDPESKILFKDVNILDSTGAPPFRGDVYIAGERIRQVGTVDNRDALLQDPKVRVVEGRGRTLMSGLGDAHVHFSWNNGDLGRLGELGVEEHTLLTARSAQVYLDSGYTMCYGAASAKERLPMRLTMAICPAQGILRMERRWPYRMASLSRALRHLQRARWRCGRLFGIMSIWELIRSS